MDGMIHKRVEEWRDSPFASMEEVAAFAAELDRIVKEAMPQPPRDVQTQVTYDHGKTDWMSADKFLDAAPDLAPLSEVELLYIASAFEDEEEPAAKADDSNFRVSLFLEEGPTFYASLSVEGRKLTAVEGVRATAKAAIENHAITKRRAEATAPQDQANAAAVIDTDVIEQHKETDQPRQPPIAQAKAIVDSKGSQWRQFFYNPWTVTVGGGLLVAVIVLLLTRS